MAVNSTLFPSDHVSIFMAKNRRERIPITQGSGFYDFELYDQNVVSVEYDAKEKELVITPLRVGHVSKFCLFEVIRQHFKVFMIKKISRIFIFYILYFILYFILFYFIFYCIIFFNFFFYYILFYILYYYF